MQRHSTARGIGLSASSTDSALQTRTDRAVAARSELGEDFFGGWHPDDRALLAQYAQAREAVPGKIVDYFGIVTSTSFHPWARHLSGAVVNDMPIPDDGLRAETIEYFATIDALNRAPAERFSMAEIGASYAPWSSFCAVLGRRTHRRVHFTAVEASSYLFELIPQHLAENQVVSSPDCDIRLMRAAVSTVRDTLYFPKVSNPGENGGQAVAERRAEDYVGRQVEYEPVKAILMSDIVTRQMDLLHVDIQGLEASVLGSSMDLLTERVGAVFVGTHSRKIEGQLLELFHAASWQLVRERPTKYVYEPTRPDIVGWTTRDGGQYWVNPKYRAKA
jgi:FkbM family methyltransferase